MYIALGFVDTGSRTYGPGEIIEEDYKGAAWHLKVGAIRLMDAPTEEREPVEEAEEAEAPDDPAEEREIDVMAGVVTKPARKRTTRKGGQTK